MPDFELASFDFQQDGAEVEVEVTVYARAAITPAFA